MNDYYRERLNLIMDKTNDLIWRMTMQRVDTPTAFKLWNDIENEYDEIMEEMPRTNSAGIGALNI